MVMISLVMCKTRHLTSDRRTKERTHASTNAKARHMRNKVPQALTGSVPLSRGSGFVWLDRIESGSRNCSGDMSRPRPPHAWLQDGNNGTRGHSSSSAREKKEGRFFFPDPQSPSSGFRHPRPPSPGAVISHFLGGGGGERDVRSGGQ